MTTPGTFIQPSNLPETPEDRVVHVWLADLRQLGDRVDQFTTALSADELERADRFQFTADRRHYISGRGVLRFLLGRYLQDDPAKVSFAYNAYGKPRLAGAHEALPLRFNVAHSQGLALFAFSRQRELGVDLEHVRREVATDEVAERFFAPAEIKALRGLPASLRTRAFFACWTRKEAFVKARGMGLSLPLNQFVVSVIPGSQPRLLSVADDPQAAIRWSLFELQPATRYQAALAVEGRDLELRCWRYG